MKFNILNIEYNGAVAIISINRPEVRNALNSEFFVEMNAALKLLKEQEKLRVVVITGKGKAFAAGADISEMKGKSEAEAIEFSKFGQQTFLAIEEFGLPVIAAINGYALGGGCELALACDIRIAAENAKIGQPEVGLGLITGYAGSQRLPRIVGRGNASLMLLTGGIFTAEEAQKMGLVQKIVEPEALIDEALKIANTIAKQGPSAIRRMKKTINHGLKHDFDTGSNKEAEEFGALFLDEGAEGISAFLEKRKPKW